MIRRTSLIAFEIIVGLLVTIGFGLFLLSWRLSSGPIDLPMIQRHIERELAEARGGRDVKIDRVELAWSGPQKGLELKARGVTLLGEPGAPVGRSAAVDIGLALPQLAIGRVAISRAAFDGADVSVTMAKDGAALVAFGPPGASPDFKLAPPPPGETLNQRVERILNGMAGAFRPVGVGGNLREITVRNARVFVIDERDGAVWRAEGAHIDLNRTRKALTFNIEAAFKGPRGPAPAKIHVETDTAFESALIQLTTKGVRPDVLLPQIALGPLAGLKAPATTALTVGLDRKRGVTRIDGDIALGRGHFEAAGGKVMIGGARLKGRYDLQTDALLIDEITVDGADTRIKGRAAVKDASAFLGANAAATARYEAALQSLDVNAPGFFKKPVSLSDVQASGVLDPKTLSVSFEKLTFKADQGRADLAGTLMWGDDGKGVSRPGVTLKGAINGVVDVRTIIDLWPVTMAETARDWVDTGIVGGRVSGVSVNIDFKPSDLAGGVLPNDKLTVAFSYDNAHVRYLDEMTPITEGRGAAVLKGNRFDLTLESGRVGALAVSQGKVELPRLNPKGALASFGGRAEGGAREMIDLLRQAPLELDEKLPADPTTIVGRGVADFVIRRPMLSDVAAEDMKFSIDSRLEGVGARAKDGRFTIADWRLRVTGDERALNLAGPMRLGDSQVNLNWTEAFRTGDEPSSRYTVSGRFSADDLVKLGLPVRDYATGLIDLEARVTGRAMDIATATVKLDMAQANVALPFDMWTKKPGRAATAQFDARETADGGLELTRWDIRASGFTMNGVVLLDKNRSIVSANIPRFVIEGRTDLRATVRRGAGRALIIDAEGAMFDAVPFLMGNPYSSLPAAPGVPGAPAKPIEPFEGFVRADRVLMKADAELTNARLDVAAFGSAITRLNVQAASPGGKAFALALGGKGVNDVTPVAFRADDAGFAYRAIVGLDNIRGGAVEGKGTWRPGAPGRADVTLKAKNFQVVRVPAMAHLLSSVGSLRGMVDMLNGEGIAFSGAEAPMTIDGGKVWLAETRAAGPSLGITVKGDIALADGKLNLDGVVVPSYGLNSILGGVPVLGPILTSRQGEGIVGMTYSIKGPAENARVGVNPLSALTPGILRRIFEPWAPNAGPPAIPATPAQAPAAQGG